MTKGDFLRELAAGRVSVGRWQIPLLEKNGVLTVIDHDTVEVFGIRVPVSERVPDAVVCCDEEFGDVTWGKCAFCEGRICWAVDTPEAVMKICIACALSARDATKH